MDRNVNLNLNILMGLANKDDPGECFNASEPHIPRASVCAQDKLFAEPSVNQRWSFSPVITAASVSGLRESERYICTGAQFVSNCQARVKADDATGMRFRRCTSKESFSVVLLCRVPSQEACCDKTWCPSLSPSHVWDTGRRTEESLWHVGSHR